MNSADLHERWTYFSYAVAIETNLRHVATEIPTESDPERW